MDHTIVRMNNTYAHLPTLKTKAATWIERGELMALLKMSSNDVLFY